MTSARGRRGLRRFPWPWPARRFVLAYDIAATLVATLGAVPLQRETLDVIGVVQGAPAAVVAPFAFFLAALAAADLARSPRSRGSIATRAIALGLGLVASAIILAALGALSAMLAVQALLLALLVGAQSAWLQRAPRPPVRQGIPASGVRTVVYGAGEAGAGVAQLGDRDPDANVQVVAFIDDDPAKAGTRVEGRPVLGGLDALRDAVDDLGAEQLLVAMGAARAETVASAFDAARALGLEVRTVPNLRPLQAADLRPAMIRPIRLDDLLPRRVAEGDIELPASRLRDASVLITGGAGSIGSELARQVLALRPARLTALDNDEEGIWAVGRELADLAPPGVDVSMRLGDIRSTASIRAALEAVHPDVVFHAAALKHVPIVETYPSEGALTNVVGTRQLLEACEALGVPRFVLISSDKAVDPTGAMGQTKRLAELLTLASAARTGRPYAAVRFGNVLGSSGSVVPTFLAQLARREPLTITDPGATRFFMTISEAVGLILHTAAIATPGEVYVLDMGRPILITDLARMLIRLAGFNPSDVPIRYTGLRPGERLHEALFFTEEIVDGTSHPGIFRVRASTADQEATAAAAALAERIEAAARELDDQEVQRLLAQVRGVVAAPRSSTPDVRDSRANAWEGRAVRHG